MRAVPFSLFFWDSSQKTQFRHSKHKQKKVVSREREKTFCVSLFVVSIVFPKLDFIISWLLQNKGNSSTVHCTYYWLLFHHFDHYYVSCMHSWQNFVSCEIWYSLFCQCQIVEFNFCLWSHLCNQIVKISKKEGIKSMGKEVLNIPRPTKISQPQRINRLTKQNTQCFWWCS